ncbi:FecR family protein [Fodinibius roseus]|uniref:FecR family protein n=1 Tax=Fodinibius roseus TaxID=1194090 RepID=A0A1M4TMZ0_9BACT|nr:FecR domain-containing protein [Fodinibius roseus]SHE45859.1 FecR family protein [Fodinibius roseus]
MSKNEEEIERLLADDSFVAWIEGSASEKEIAKWRAWLENDPARKQILKEAQSFHGEIDFKGSRRPEVDTELYRLKEAVDNFERSAERENETAIFRIHHKTSYSNVAAVILLLVTVLSIATFINPPEVYQSDSLENAPRELITATTQNGQQKALALSDGSKIILNANSSLTYPSQYTGGDLEVSLEGEAYFNIVNNPGSGKRSFSVNVPGGAVEVVGTKFNVNTYDQTTEVVLVEGRVDVKMRDRLSRVKDSYVMAPGEMSRMSLPDGTINTTRVESDMYVAWTQDKLVFDRTPLAEVAKRIKDIYGVDFQLNDYELRETLVSGSLPNNNINVFLNTLENMLERPVTNKNGVIILGEQKSETNHE